MGTAQRRERSGRATSAAGGARLCRAGAEGAPAVEVRRGIETLLLEERRYPPSPEFAAQANAQPGIYDVPLEEFWGARRVSA